LDEINSRIFIENLSTKTNNPIIPEVVAPVGISGIVQSTVIFGLVVGIFSLFLFTLVPILITQIVRRRRALKRVGNGDLPGFYVDIPYFPLVLESDRQISKEIVLKLRQEMDQHEKSQKVIVKNELKKKGKKQKENNNNLRISKKKEDEDGEEIVDDNYESEDEKKKKNKIHFKQFAQKSKSENRNKEEDVVKTSSDLILCEEPIIEDLPKVMQITRSKRGDDPTINESAVIKLYNLSTDTSRGGTVKEAKSEERKTVNFIDSPPTLEENEENEGGSKNIEMGVFGSQGDELSGKRGNDEENSSGGSVEDHSLSSQEKD
jgi:hypothetical protein